MCGRFTLRTPTPVLIEHFGLGRIPALPARFNIAPMQQVAAVRQAPDAEARELVMLRWGLVPSWAKDTNNAARLINARSETVAEKPSYRHAVRRQRCLIPSDGFYEWKKTGREKQTFHIQMADGSLFAMAGLWERWRPDEKLPPLETCTILTTEPNELMQGIHDRMPVILPPEAYATWLDPQFEAYDALQELFRPFPADAMAAEPIGSYVNSVQHEGPQCLERQRSLF
ncbi:MAG: SOS response-associated peptidase [Planctomycetales bacterium]|nr:SOS response-associated peptidase [Planctomycetales bacterium]